MFNCNVALQSGYHGKSTTLYYYIFLPLDISIQIAHLTADQPSNGRKSIKVRVRIAFISRETSIFPDKTSGCYLLLIKKEIRTELKIKEGDDINLTVELINK